MLMEARVSESGNRFEPLPFSRPFSATRFERLIESAGVHVNYASRVEIFGEDEPFDYFYRVLSGAVRTYRILVDGRHQICTFNLQGEVFGFEVGDVHGCSAEAITNCRLLVIKRSTVICAAQHDTEILQKVWGIADTELKRVQGHVLLLVKTAKERVAAFLWEMAQRMLANDGCHYKMAAF